MTGHLDAALGYAARGWPVFALAPGSKRPMAGSGGVGDATTDPAVIREVWTAEPKANIGGALGHGRIALDSDPEEGADATLKELPPLPPTRTHASGGADGGHHLIYLAPPGTPGRKLGPGVTVRGLGSYVVLPPSVLADGGEYAVLDDRPEVDAPGWLLTVLTIHTPPGGGLPLEVEVLVDRLPRHLREILAEDPDADRSGQLHHLVAAAMEWGLDDREVVFLARQSAPAQAKYGGRLDSEIARVLAKVRADHPHPGAPCDRADCPTTPTWMGATAVPTISPEQAAHLAAVPVYPLEAIGGPIADLVKATPMLPAALVGGAALGALAHLAAPARLALVDGWTEAPILWVPLLGPAGSGKSPALRRAWGPLWDYGLLADRLLDDLTIEKLARMLEDTAGMAAIVTDELATTLGSLGRYHRSGPSSDRGRLLALWSGGPWRYSRVTAKVDLLIEAPVVVVTGPLVSEQHRLLGPAGDGMRPRWLPHLVAQGDDGGDLDTRPAGGGGWSDLVKDLAAVQRPRVWHLDGTARGDWLAARKRWKALARADEPDTVRLAAAKADTHAARVALALAEGHDPGSGGPVPPEAVTGALAVLDYVIDCWRALGEGEVLALSRRDEELDAAVDRMAAWIERRPSKAANRRELGRSKVGGARTTKELDAVIERYAERFPGTVEHNVIPEGGGTPQTVVHAPSRG